MPAGRAYSNISKVTLSSSASEINFDNIPQTFTDLILICDGYAATGDGGSIQLRFNANANTVYSSTALSGNGTNTLSQRITSQTVAYASYAIGWSTTSTTRANQIINIFNYSNSSTNKVVLSRSSIISGSYPGTEIVTSNFRSTTAITSLRVTIGGGTFGSSSIFSLYGVSAA